MPLFVLITRRLKVLFCYSNGCVWLALPPKGAPPGAFTNGESENLESLSCVPRTEGLRLISRRTHLKILHKHQLLNTAPCDSSSEPQEEGPLWAESLHWKVFKSQVTVEETSSFSVQTPLALFSLAISRKHRSLYRFLLWIIYRSTQISSAQKSWFALWQKR